MNKARLIPAIALGAVAMIAFSGCQGGAAPATDGDVTLKLLTFETPALTAEFWNDSIDAALESVPGVEIEQLLSPDADRNAYAKQLQASGQFPDLLSSIAPGDFVSAGLLEAYDTEWLEENFLLPEATYLDGKAYFPPTNSQILPLVFYNKTIFEENGLEVPTDWDEFYDTVVALRAAGVTPIELAGLDAWSSSMPIVALASADVLGDNPEWIQERKAGDVAFSDPEFADAMQKQLDLIEAGAYDPAALSVDFATANQNFLDGKSGMYIMGSWFTGSGYVTPEQAANLGAFPLPTDDGDIVIPFAVGGTMSIASEGTDPAKAMDFAKAWSLAPQNMKTLIETDGAFPMMKNIPFGDYDATVNTLYEESFAFVPAENEKVSSFGWAANDDTLIPGMNDLFYALSQQLFTNSDLDAQLAQLDADWDAAAANER